MDDALGRKLEGIRKKLSVAQDTVYMNTGSMGLLSEAARRAMKRELGSVAGNSREPNAIANAFKTIDLARRSIAALIHADAGEVSITNSTTHGICTVLFSFDWQAGDEIITSDLEHFAVIQPLMALRDRFGVVLRYFEANSEWKDSFVSLVTPRTRLVAVSHVSYSTGEVLPVGEIIRLAHDKEVPVLLDGAQAAGAIAVDVKDLGVDYYSLPGQKWLFGPQGTGALYISPAVLGGGPPFVASVKNPPPYESIQPRQGLRKYELFTCSHVAAAGFAASADWLVKNVTAGFAYSRIAQITGYLKQQLATVPGIQVVTPAEAAGLTSFRAEFASDKELLDYLTKRGVLLRNIEPFGFLRVSTSYFNTEAEVDTLIEALRSYQPG